MFVLRIKKPNICSLIDALILCYMIAIGLFSSNKYHIITNGIAFLLILVLFVYHFMRNRFVFYPFVKIFLAFLLFCYASILWAWSREITIVKCTTLTILCALYCLMYHYLVAERKLDFFIRAMCINGFVYALGIIIFYGGVGNFLHELSYGTRMGAEIANVNTIGMTTALGALFCLWEFLYKKRRWGAVFFALCVFIALSSGSRKALIALVMGMGMLFVLRQEHGRRGMAVLQMLGAMYVFFLVLQLPMFDTINTRFEQMIDTFLGSGPKEASADERMRMMQIGWRQFLDTPFWGTGIGGSAVLTMKTLAWSTYLHNNYAELLSSIGIIGTGIFYSFFFVPLYKCYKMHLMRTAEGKLMVIILAIYLFLQMAVVIYDGKLPYFYIMFGFLVVDSYAYGEKNE